MNNVLWPDAELQTIKVDYDAVIITIQEATGATRTVRGEGYIGYQMCGFWDEIVLVRAELFDQHPAIDRCTDMLTRRMGSAWHVTGNQARNGRNWKALILHFSDESTFELVAAQFSVE